MKAALPADTGPAVHTGGHLGAGPANLRELAGKLPGIPKAKPFSAS